MEVESDKEIGLRRAEICMKMSVFSVLHEKSPCWAQTTFFIHGGQVSI